jgi:hypothetical protein
MAVGKASKSQEAYYARYKTSLFSKNRTRRLERVLKAQPNNEQVKMALKDIHYRRKTPNTTVWSASDKRLAQMLRSWTGGFDMNILNSNPKVASDALQGLPSRQAVKQDDTLQNRHMFSLKTRIKVRGQLLFPTSTKLNGLTN